MSSFLLTDYESFNKSRNFLTCVSQSELTWDMDAPGTMRLWTSYGSTNTWGSNWNISCAPCDTAHDDSQEPGPLDMWSGLGWSLLASTERRNESLATCSQGWSLMTRVWEEISIGSVWKTFRFSQQGLMMISLHQDHPCDSQNIRWSTNKKETKKERGEKKQPLNQKTERKKLLNWFDSQKDYTRERAEIARDKRKGKDRKAYCRANESSW